MSLYIVGFAGSEALAYAIKLGVALQLTNILRDVEDYRAGRVYLPGMMSRLNPAKLHLRSAPGLAPEDLAGRRYTLTHSDATGDLFLTIGPD